MNKLYVVMIVLVALTSCGSAADDGKTYHDNFEVGAIPGVDSFQLISDVEKRLDSIYNVYGDIDRDLLPGSWPIPDSTSPMGRNGAFLNNRSRMYSIDTLTKKYRDHPENPMPALCGCIIDKDTLLVGSIVGFFGGYGFTIKIFKDQFISSYEFYADDVKPYRYNMSDSMDLDEIVVGAKYQHLILDEVPTYKPGQQLTGLLNYTSNRFYEHTGAEFEPNYLIRKIYFKCVTAKK